MFFSGRYEHSINGQGRTSIPHRFREELEKIGADKLIVTNLQECLVAYPPDEWKKEIERFLSKVPQSSREAIEYRRFFVSGAQECPIDKQGRILLPPTLREHASLNKDIIFVGQMNYIEIWDKQKWEAVFGRAKDNFENSMQKLSEWGY